MATINNIYVQVVDESVGRKSIIPQHPVEQGLPLTDNVKSEPITLSISGKIVNTSQYDAPTILSKLNALRDSGSLVKYAGRNLADNFMIESFDSDHPNTNWGGADFTMELVQVRVAKSSYSGNTNQTQKAAEKEKQTTSPTLTVGSIVVFTGGPVYVSSDAKKAAATRGRSTCKIAHINERSWSIHSYCLISTDGGMVYGWVDKSNIEGTGSSGTSGTTNLGTQQVTSK